MIIFYSAAKPPNGIMVPEILALPSSRWSASVTRTRATNQVRLLEVFAARCQAGRACCLILKNNELEPHKQRDAVVIFTASYPLSPSVSLSWSHGSKLTYNLATDEPTQARPKNDCDHDQGVKRERWASFKGVPNAATVEEARKRLV